MPFIAIETAAMLRFPDGTHVQTPEAYLGWHRLHVDSCAVAVVFGSEASVIARIDHGRWIADCVCRTGMYTHPLWKMACCGECGAVYRDVVFPMDWPFIERELLKRPVRANQNWFPTETLDMLQRESAAHGVT
jgi:hypothetical protein